MYIKDVIRTMEDYAPPHLAEAWDNVGLLIGNESLPVTKIIAALDINDAVIDEALNNNANLIITHHPLIFSPLSSITAETPLGRRIIKLIKNDIAVFSAHTNLDKTSGGTNDTLFRKLGFTLKQNLFDTPDEHPGLIGELKDETTLLGFAAFLKDRLELPNITITGDKNSSVKRVALCTGSGGDIKYIEEARTKNCDVYITGDIKYHTAQYATDLGLCLIDATHYATEVIITEKICGYLLERGFDCTVSKINGQMLNIV